MSEDGLDVAQDAELTDVTNTVYDVLRLIKDPEKDATLEDLDVIREDCIKVTRFNSDKYHIGIQFVPTVPHCSLATLIGLCIRVKLERSLPYAYKTDITLAPGSHETEHDDIIPNMDLKKAILSMSVFCIASEILYRLYQRVASSSREKKNKGRFIFFPDKGILQGNYAQNGKTNNTPIEKSRLLYDMSLINISSGKECNKRLSDGTEYNKSILATSTSLIHLVNLIDSAQQNLMVCVMVITCTQLADSIIRAKKRGVSVRVVADSTMVETNGCQLSKLRKSNILIRAMSCPGGLMHNKFAVIDAHYLRSEFAKSSKSSGGTAMSGSFNWTWTAVICNEENVYISSDADFVNPLAEKFEEIWEREQ